MKQHRNDIIICIQLSIKKMCISNRKADTSFFAIKRSNLIICNCKTKLQKSFFVPSCLWRHLNSFELTLDYTTA